MRRAGIIITFLCVLVLQSFSQDIKLIDGYYYKKDMLYTGKHIESYENGKPKLVMYIHNGLKDGLVISYYENGIQAEQKIL